MSNFFGNRPLLLDLFCCAGGAAMGYYLAGFEVVGVDIRPQKNYPFTFYQGDALEFVAKHGQEFEAIHASPPCQFATVMFNPKTGRNPKHENLIPQTRQALMATGKPYVIENVPGAVKHLINPILLTGSMFGLNLFRKRYFEIWPDPPALFAPSTPRYDFLPAVPCGSYSDKQPGRDKVGFVSDSFDIHWMNRMELRQAIPPAYTEFIGKCLLKQLEKEWAV